MIIYRRHAQLRLKKVCAFIVIQKWLNLQTLEVYRRAEAKKFKIKLLWVSVKWVLKCRNFIKNISPHPETRLRLETRNNCLAISNMIMTPLAD